MFNLIPWKKRNNGGNVVVHHEGPSHELSSFPSHRFGGEFEALMNRFFSDPWFSFGGRPSTWASPRFGWNFDLGWEDKDSEYVFHAELPGFEPEDFEVKVSNDTLTVRAEHKAEQTNKNGGSTWRYGSFSRTFTLPHGVAEDKIDARYRRGILEVHLPKTEQARGKRIPVNAN